MKKEVGRLFLSWTITLTRTGRNIPFVSHVKYRGAKSGKIHVWVMHMQHLLESPPYSKEGHHIPNLH